MNSFETYRSEKSILENINQLMRGSDLLVQTLEKIGIRQVFGIPGGAVGSIFNSLSQSRLITTTLCQHEGGAAYMALGRSLGTISKGEMGLCFATSGPGITNLISGVAAAYEERVPIFVLTGNVSTQLIGRGAAQDAFVSGINAVKMLEPVTWQSITVTDALKIPEMVQTLYRGALESGLPVHLNVPLNVASDLVSSRNLSQKSAQDSALVIQTTSSESNAKVKAAVRAFFLSPRPVIFAGNGIKVSGYKIDLRKFVETTSIPIIQTSHAKGTFPEDHPLYRGCFGFAAQDQSRKFLEQWQPTAILYLGTRLGETATLGWSPLLAAPPLRIHVDRDDRQLNKVTPVDYALKMDLGDFFREALKMWGELNLKNVRELGNISDLDANLETDHTARLTGPVHPGEFLECLDLCLPDNAMLFSDIGSSMAWAIHHLTIREGQDFYVPMGLGAMGSGLCGAIGAKSAMLKRPVVCISGDGSVMMHGSELLTAFNAGLGIKLFVLNDGGFGIVEHGQKLVGFSGDISVRYRRAVDFVQFAAALGVNGFSIRSLGDLFALPLDELLTSEEPIVFDIQADPRPLPPISSRTRVLGMSEKRSV